MEGGETVFIFDMTGHVLALLDANDLGSVVYAERWIKDHGYVVYLFEQREGFTYITVKEV